MELRFFIVGWIGIGMSGWLVRLDFESWLLLGSLGLAVAVVVRDGFRVSMISLYLADSGDDGFGND